MPKGVYNHRSAAHKRAIAKLNSPEVAAKRKRGIKAYWAKRRTEEIGNTTEHNATVENDNETTGAKLEDAVLAENVIFLAANAKFHKNLATRYENAIRALKGEISE